MLIGPIFAREASLAPRGLRHYAYRVVYIVALLVLIGTAWLVVAGTQTIGNVGDMARFGAILFQILAPLQLALAAFLGVVGSASSVAQEKDRRTLLLLLLTRMNNSELVLGKLLASLLNVGTMLLAGLPVFMVITLLGGVSWGQVARVAAVCTTTALLAGSLGVMLGFWREKTFQTLAIAALSIVLWLTGWEAAHRLLADASWFQLGGSTWAAAFSPIEAIVQASRPSLGDATAGGGLAVLAYVACSSLLAAVLSGIAIWRVRIWNPSREVRRGAGHVETGESLEAIFDSGGPGASDPSDLSDPSGRPAALAERAREGHIDSVRRARREHGPSRAVWDNPVLWREICTWAYGRKVVLVQLAYLLFAVLMAVGVRWAVQEPPTTDAVGLRALIPPPAVPLAPLLFVSIVVINALAVTSITNERDGQALDLLLVTDLTPREFVFGKLGGVLWVTKQMWVWPLLMCSYVWWEGVMTGEDLVYLLLVVLITLVFAAMLGVHCGMTYASSRTAIGVSLGAVFFLFLGVVTCLMVMISFSGSFQRQLPAFLAFSLGGSVGLYVALGIRNPSRAIFWATLLLPIGTFHAITSFLIGQTTSAFLVTTSIYAFTTAAMLVPAIGEFDFAMGRTKVADG